MYSNDRDTYDYESFSGEYNDSPEQQWIEADIEDDLREDEEPSS